MRPRRSLRPLRIALLVFIASAILAEGENTRQQPFLHGAAGENPMLTAIRHELLMLPDYGVFDDLAFTLDSSGSVTLFGAVAHRALRRSAEAAVRRVEGVAGVVNQIEFLPPSPLDDSIRFAEYRAIYDDAILSMRYGYRSLLPIHIIVKDGRVTLEGVVASEVDRNLVNTRAHGVLYVLAVTNNLRVEPD